MALNPCSPKGTLQVKLLGCVCVCVCVCVCARAHVHVWHVCACMRVCAWRAHVRARMCACVHGCVCVCVCVCVVSPMHASTAKMNLFTIAEMDKSASIYINLWIKIFYFSQQTVAD